MAENLKVTHYKEGDAIATISYSNPDWQHTTEGAYYNYNPAYGNIYNGFAVKDDRGICPDGWHVPSDDSFIDLEMYTFLFMYIELYL